MHEDIWLEVSNVRMKGAEYEVQLRADREPERPRWWPAPTVNTAAEFKTLIDALDKKRPVLAQLVPDCTPDGTVPKRLWLKVNSLSVQYAEVAR